MNGRQEIQVKNGRQEIQEREARVLLVSFERGLFYTCLTDSWTRVLLFDPRFSSYFLLKTVSPLLSFCLSQLVLVKCFPDASESLVLSFFPFVHSILLFYFSFPLKGFMHIKVTEEEKNKRKFTTHDRNYTFQVDCKEYNKQAVLSSMTSCPCMLTRFLTVNPKQ